MNRKPALLVLSDGTVFPGVAFGAATTVVGEVVFNTCLTGYQEVITDPSYHGQMVCMTTPHIGNTGINREDLESAGPQLVALLVREISHVISHWRAHTALPEWLRHHGVPGISEIDTRLLTRQIREHGVVHAALCTDGSKTPEALQAIAAQWPGLEGLDLVKEVTCRAPYSWDTATSAAWVPPDDPAGGIGTETDDRPLVVAYDFGIKFNILRRLTSHGLRVQVVPAHTAAPEAAALQPDGYFLSNGPGDPSALPYATRTVQSLIQGDVPVFGICLGHQLIARALGADTYKLKFGHHGGNQPVSSRVQRHVEITAQNHNYSVSFQGLPPNVEVTHWNLNDDTVEGLRLTDKPVFCVQYHPEASPGPHDADALFAQFAAAVRNYRRQRRSPVDHADALPLPAKQVPRESHP